MPAFDTENAPRYRRLHHRRSCPRNALTPDQTESESGLHCLEQNGWERRVRPRLRRPLTFRLLTPAGAVLDAAVHEAAERLRARREDSTRAISFRRRELCRWRIVLRVD